jgi:hypothetical protein
MIDRETGTLVVGEGVEIAPSLLRTEVRTGKNARQEVDAV